MLENENQDRKSPAGHSPECFRELDPEELKLIEKKKTQLLYLKGENLFKQGAFAPYVMYVVDGLVKLYLQTGANRQINIRLARRGDFLPSAAAVAAAPAICL